MKTGASLILSALANMVAPLALLAGGCSPAPGLQAGAPMTQAAASAADAGSQTALDDRPGDTAALSQSDAAASPSSAPALDDAPQVSQSDPSAGATPGVSTTSHIALRYLIGDVDPAADDTFARIPDKYIAGNRVWGHKDAVAAFVRMAEEAAANGYRLRIVSAFRSFSDQKTIWENKWNGKTPVGGRKLNVDLPDPKARALKILEFSSMPGTSRHHWGTDFDINALDNAYFSTREGRHVYDWLVAHASNFGFCQVYTKKGPESGRETGYEEEKWHWSYRPVADWYLRQYPVDVGYERITGFAGAETAREIDVIDKYVRGIDPQCVQ